MANNQNDLDANVRQLPGPPEPKVDNADKASVGELIAEFKALRVYVGHLYLAYKDLQNIKGDMETTLQSAISYRDQTAAAARKIDPVVTQLESVNSTLNDILESLGLTGEK